MDGGGNLYGTTALGGAHNAGTVFELSPKAAASPGGGASAWTMSTIYSFTGGQDGGMPLAPVVMDRAGNLYGTTTGGCGGPCTATMGNVFRLAPTRTGGVAGWTETSIHNFSSAGTDGIIPYAGLAIDSSGSLYGTTYQGGTGLLGTVFRLTPPAAGNPAVSGTPVSSGWTETILHNFGSTHGFDDGVMPISGVILDAQGNIYGTTAVSNLKFGTVFKLAKPSSANAKWTETILYEFQGKSADGGEPKAALSMDNKGRLYGSTSGSFEANPMGQVYQDTNVGNLGTVFMLAP